MKQGSTDQTFVMFGRMALIPSGFLLSQWFSLSVDGWTLLKDMIAVTVNHAVNLLARRLVRNTSGCIQVGHVGITMGGMSCDRPLL